ncbi:MAG: multifunctional CCA tRNA nucleotidyl transferase/2'3'-cyclic phosphodiesterase/2'nucleotidase/phosphatase [Gammaproteobacteria bacterium]|nr:multifunctional CCA tRNA nucleotidyl transferase/2'3'-cyclic phosphodiesterase/2'nucleotidase/phosphatase [Gammaproteobacteria bacterium]
MHLPVKERDYVVVGATTAEMLKLGYRQVGKEFPVFLHPQTNEEYALARMERKVKPGYKGFTFDTSPHVSVEEDLLRRDLTINAMAIDLETEQLIDPYGGQQDIQAKMLRHVSSAFAEDPVRLLRVGRFLARFSYLGFQVAPETLALMRDMAEAGEVDALVAERVWKELERSLGEKNPEKFFVILAKTHALKILFPALHVDGAGIKALKSAATLTSDTLVRFAALLHALPETETNNTETKKIIATLCHRYRVPNAYQELAQLTALHYQKALAAKTLSAQALVQLFNTLDIFRREERFNKFLLSCLAIANSQQIVFDMTWLKSLSQLVKTVDVQVLLSQGLAGRALAEKLNAQREEKVQQWLAHL